MVSAFAKNGGKPIEVGNYDAAWMFVKFLPGWIVANGTCG